jgi:hypothetical protein
MKLRILAILGALLAGTTFTQANIVGQTLADDGDGVITCSAYDLLQTGDTDFQLSIDGIHHDFDHGHILGNIITDTETDPSLTLLHSIDNDTGFTWTDYHVKVVMNKAFTFSNVTVANNLWYAVVTAPTQVGSDWIGNIDYFSGDPVPNLGTLDFSYKMTFIGSAAFFEELTPTSVPEPTTLAFVLCGLAGLFVLQRRSAS